MSYKLYLYILETHQCSFMITFSYRKSYEKTNHMRITESYEKIKISISSVFKLLNQLHFLVLLISSCKFGLFSRILSFHLERFPLILLVGQVYLWISKYCLSLKVLLLLQFGRIVFLDIDSLIHNLFLSIHRCTTSESSWILLRRKYLS